MMEPRPGMVNGGRLDPAGPRIEVCWGEISSPAIVSVGGWVFEIHEEGMDLLVRPPKPRD